MRRSPGPNSPSRIPRTSPSLTSWRNARRLVFIGHKVPSRRTFRGSVWQKLHDSRSGFSLIYALWVRVDVDCAAAGEARERQAAVAREVDGQRRRGADADEDGGACDGRLLDELEGQPAAHAQHAGVQRDEPVEEGPADDLVHRVVAPDVLADEQQVALGA